MFTYLNLLFCCRVKGSPTGGGSWFSCPLSWKGRLIRMWMTSPVMTSWWHRYTLCTVVTAASLFIWCMLQVSISRYKALIFHIITLFILTENTERSEWSQRDSKRDNTFNWLSVCPFQQRNTSEGGSTPCALCFTVPACYKSRVSQSSLRSALVTTATRWTPPANPCRPPHSTALLCLMVRKLSPFYYLLLSHFLVAQNFVLGTCILISPIFVVICLILEI